MLLASACALLTAAEIARVQGEAPAESKASASESADLLVERCFYSLPTFARSISLEVTRGKGARAFWARSFHEEHEDRELPPPEKVRGVGEEAFWTGDPRLGGLYLLKKGAIVRLSIGGNQTKADKLRKLKQLARPILKRL